MPSKTFSDVMDIAELRATSHVISPSPSDLNNGEKSSEKGHVHTQHALKALLVRSEVGKWYEPVHQGAVQELQGLSQALDLNIIDTWVCRLRRSPHPGTFLGKGWVDRVREFIDAKQIEVIIMDPDLTAIQQRVLEKTWKCPVWDRTALILRIFQSRARTAAGRLQVSLASLLYQKSRLVRAWTHLERQRGGFGFLGGPGESQLELDRRILESKIMKIKKQLETVRKTRALHRKSRKSMPIVALVGYTNTGKSTLFRGLTNTDVLCADMPFATLDPTTRSVYLPSGRSVLLTDTVGFISQLPAFLKLAFQATLEEITNANLIIHVRDQSAPTSDAQKVAVLGVLAELKCHQQLANVSYLLDGFWDVPLWHGATACRDRKKKIQECKLIFSTRLS
jgi:GTP-binding protein HflX